MTLDEAIKYAEYIVETNLPMIENYPDEYGYIEKYYDRKECVEECQQLIEWLKELKALRTERTSDDLISRADVIDAMAELQARASSKGELTGISKAWKKIKGLPSAKQTGAWIGEADGYADGWPVYDMWYCSECDYAVESDEIPIWNFCPNCGARMKNDNE